MIGENEAEEDVDEAEPAVVAHPKPKLFCSARLIFLLVCLVAVFNVSYVRVGISMALICMVENKSGNGSSERSHASKTGEFHWSSFTKGTLTSAAFYGFIVGPFVSGFLSFRYGGKVILVIATLAAGSANFFVPEGTRLTPVLFFILRVLIGFFAGFTFPAFYDLVTHWVVAEERQLLVGNALVGIPLASIINFPVNTLICFLWGWIWIFYILGMWLLTCGIIFVFTIYDYPESCWFISPQELGFLKSRIPKPVKSKIPWKQVMSSMPIYAYIVMHFAMNYLYLSTILSLPLLMEQVYKMTLTENGFLSAVPFVGSFLMRIFLSFFFEPMRIKLKMSKNGMRKVLTFIGAVICGVCLFAVTFLGGPYRYLVLSCFIIFSCSLELCITGGYLLSLLDLCPSYVNVITGLANSIGNTAGLICPIVNGSITKDGTKKEWNIVFYVNICVLALATIFYLVFGQNHLQYWGLTTLAGVPAVPRASIVN